MEQAAAAFVVTIASCSCQVRFYPRFLFFSFFSHFIFTLPNTFNSFAGTDVVRSNINIDQSASPGWWLFFIRLSCLENCTSLFSLGPKAFGLVPRGCGFKPRWRHLWDRWYMVWKNWYSKIKKLLNCDHLYQTVPHR